MKAVAFLAQFAVYLSIGHVVTWAVRAMRGNAAILVLALVMTLGVGGCSKQEVVGGFRLKSADEVTVVSEELNSLGFRGASHYDGAGMRDGINFTTSGLAHNGEFAGLPVEVCLETWSPATPTTEPVESSVGIRVSSRSKSKAENAVQRLEEHLRQRIRERLKDKQPKTAPH